jgi:hypothetical protein
MVTIVLDILYIQIPNPTFPCCRIRAETSKAMRQPFKTLPNPACKRVCSFVKQLSSLRFGLLAIVLLCVPSYWDVLLSIPTAATSNATLLLLWKLCTCSLNRSEPIPWYHSVILFRGQIYFSIDDGTIRRYHGPGRLWLISSTRRIDPISGTFYSSIFMLKCFSGCSLCTAK